MERAFLRSDSVVPEDAEVGPPAAPGGDEPGGALIVTETWMLILSEGSTEEEEGGSELGLDGGGGRADDGEDGDPAVQAALTQTRKSNLNLAGDMVWHARRNNTVYQVWRGQPCQHNKGKCTSQLSQHTHQLNVQSRSNINP